MLERFNLLKQIASAEMLEKVYRIFSDKVKEDMEMKDVYLLNKLSSCIRGAMTGVSSVSETLSPRVYKMSLGASEELLELGLKVSYDDSKVESISKDILMTTSWGHFRNEDSLGGLLKKIVQLDYYLNEKYGDDLLENPSKVTDSYLISIYFVILNAMSEGADYFSLSNETLREIIREEMSEDTLKEIFLFLDSLGFKIYVNPEGQTCTYEGSDSDIRLKETEGMYFLDMSSLNKEGTEVPDTDNLPVI